MGGLLSLFRNRSNGQIRCQTCKNMATCRGSVVVDHDFFQYDRKPQTVNSVKTLACEDELKILLIDLIPYWFATSYDGTKTRITWISCKECLPEKLRRRFQYIPNGWHHNIKYATEYESLIL